jgi:hypothetical protein
MAVAAGDTRTIEGAESELYDSDSGASRDVSLYLHKFTIFRSVEPRSMNALIMKGVIDLKD